MVRVRKSDRGLRHDVSSVRVPDGIKAIPLTQGRYALVDEEDYESVSAYKWCVTRCGHIMNSKAGYLHRFITKAPKGFVVDHIDHDTFNNTKSNLRVCKHKDNIRNARPKNNSSSKYKGVSWSKAAKKWIATIGIGMSVQKHLGLFDSEIEAAKAYDKAAKEYFGEFAYLNFGEDNKLINYLAQPVYE